MSEETKKKRTKAIENPKKASVALEGHPRRGKVRLLWWLKRPESSGDSRVVFLLEFYTSRCNVIAPRMIYPSLLGLSPMLFWLRRDELPNSPFHPLRLLLQIQPHNTTFSPRPPSHPWHPPTPATRPPTLYVQPSRSHTFKRLALRFCNISHLLESFSILKLCLNTLR